MKFENPIIRVEKMEVVDVITASEGGSGSVVTPNNPNETPKG